jgi:hypothetical protein
MSFMSGGKEQIVRRSRCCDGNYSIGLRVLRLDLAARDPHDAPNRASIKAIRTADCAIPLC